MENEQSGDIGSFLAGFIIGGLVGAAAALILAPQSGAETRDRLAAESAHLREVGSERLEDARERAQATATQVQDQARIVLDEGKTRLGVSDSLTAEESNGEQPTANGDAAPPTEPGENA